MAQDLAARPDNQHSYYSFFRTLKPAIDQTVPEPSEFLTPEALSARAAALEQSFESDMRRVAEVSELLFGVDTAAYGARCAAVFSRWEAEGGGPALTAMVMQATQYFELDIESAPVQAAFIAAMLAEIPNDLQYHGNEHYRKVLFHTIRLVAAHNQAPDGQSAIEKDDIALLLAAACIHDLGHEGGDNAREGVYTPGMMEQRAFDLARPYLLGVGLDAESVGQIETLVFCTDITFFAGDNSPCVRMKKIYKHVFYGDNDEDVSIMMMGKLRRYEDNPKLVLMAMLLHEADVGTSAGLSYERTKTETISFLAERNIMKAGPKTVLAFLRDQLGETMFTAAGKRLFGPVMAQVIEQAEEDIAAGRETF
ncbi:MAG: hypothetical protein HYS17_06050 [Micavibrio aeruginosavorus]|uniref:HD/PDEase domain-containing protein n=1 Tax=Micavibrio aeruginosavorus TaxID=349221 RepID=A0A7T5R079_9BACT|nr:MAG: hypothetical protein HYS17_06050 [Micavibrio aeruginosavorus]